ncbi:MAG TPA: helix-turn-helix transcriptional regulator [Candidatus Angelobacter sp.]|jgi:transcriptional regulator with XRE-family HTH domain|nr:helix-turn-helix transcriptional regulator [Candidatus Angelobacter sp.]
MNARFLKEARRGAGWSQQKAATELGVSQSYLSMIETGERPLDRGLARKMVHAYGLPASFLPSEERWAPKKFAPQHLAEELAALGYPGFAYLRKPQPSKNPGEILLMALASEHLEARLFEALPWLILKYWDMDRNWLVEHAKLHDLQNRLGFIVTLARSVAHKAAPTNAQRDAALESLESTLRSSLLAREESLGQSRLTQGERNWLKRYRPKQAKQWNLLTSWRPELLRYVA